MQWNLNDNSPSWEREGVCLKKKALCKRTYLQGRCGAYINLTLGPNWMAAGSSRGHRADPRQALAELGEKGPAEQWESCEQRGGEQHTSQTRTSLTHGVEHTAGKKGCITGRPFLLREKVRDNNLCQFTLRTLRLHFQYFSFEMQEPSSCDSLMENTGGTFFFI